MKVQPEDHALGRTSPTANGPRLVYKPLFNQLHQPEMRYRRKSFGHSGFHHASAAPAGLIDEHLQGIAPIASGETRNY